MTNNSELLVAAIEKQERVYSAAIDRLRELASSEAENEVYDITLLLREAIELARVARRLTKGRTVTEIHSAFGAPGDFGYENPIGRALARVYGLRSTDATEQEDGPSFPPR